MLNLFLTNLPLAFAASISVTSFILFFSIFVSKENQVRNSFAFIIGGIIACIGIAYVVHLSFGHVAPVHSSNHNNISAIVDFVLAAICLVLIILSLRKGDKPKKKKEAKLPGGAFTYVASGALMRVVSANTLPPFIAAVKNVSGAQLSVMSAIISLALIILVSSLPLIVPWLIFLFNKEKALALIEPATKFLERNKKKISNTTLLLVAIYLTIHGLRHLGA